MKMKKISHQIVTSVALLLIGFMAIVVVVVRGNTNSMLKDVVEDKLLSESTLIFELLDEKYEGDWEVRDDVLYKGETIINDNNELVDTIKNITGEEVTFFANDIRVATTIEGEGEQVLGTALTDPEVAEKVFQENETYIGMADIGDESYNTTYIPLPGSSGETVGMFFLGLPTTFQDTISFSFTSQLLMYMVVLAIISFVITYFIGQTLAKPIVRLDELAINISDLDFSEDIDDDLLAREDEVGHLAQSFQTLSNSLREVVGGVANEAEVVAAQSQELTATSSQTELSAEELSNVLQEIAGSATSQAHDVEQGATAVGELERVIEINNANVVDLNNSIELVNRLKDEGLELIADLVEKTDETRVAAQEINQIIEETDESADNIAQAIEMIKSIAEQTNLLALNASIESARAGEAGRGFAVVAEEIRTLAEESGRFAEDVELTVNDLTAKTENAVKTVDNLGRIIDIETDGVQRTDGKFQGIASSIEEIQQVITQINQSNELISNQEQQLSYLVDNLAAVAEENAAGTEEALASVEEQQLAMVEISKASDELARVAEDVNQALQAFSL